ncbi:MAG: radical SAM protein [Bacteroidales bacterium]|nr:radical SAM protein [Bacteroidales bacterium]
MSKLSRYNYFLDYEDKKLLFNGLKGSGFCMTQSEYTLLQKMFANLDFFEKTYPDDFLRLKKLGYIIEDSFDEIAFIRFKNKQKVFSDRHYHLIINPTQSCNFRCWYCYEDHKSGKMSDTTIRRLKKHLKIMIENERIPSLHIGWFGGEPLLCFDSVVYPVSLYAKRLCKRNNIPFTLSITTNAYLINNDMTEKLKRIGLNNYQITLDGDREKHDSVRNNNGMPSYDKIIENINLICNKLEHAHINLRINYDETTFTRRNIFSVLDAFPLEIRGKISINTQKVWQTTGNQTAKEQDLMPEFISQANEKKYRLTCQGSLNIGSYHTCYASRINYANINYDGLVYKCTARNYTKENALGELTKEGNIVWKADKIARMYATSPMENKECLNCIYLPICCGKCVQNFIEHGSGCHYKENKDTYFSREIIRFYKNQKINSTK